MADNLNSGLDCVLTDVDEARGLPNSHYISAAVFEEENQALLSENWAGIGFIGDVPNPGDVKPIQFLGTPLDGGKFSPIMDGPTYTFHHWVASKMNEHRNSQQG